MSSLAKIRCGQVTVMLGCLFLGTCLAPIIAGSAPALGAGALAAAGIIIGTMVMRAAAQGQESDATEIIELRDLVAGWHRYARQLEREAEAAAQPASLVLPSEVETVRARIAAEAAAAGAAVQSLLDHAITFRKMNAGLDARLAQAETERDAARAELAIVDEMQERRKENRIAVAAIPVTPALDDTPAEIAAPAQITPSPTIEVALADLLAAERVP